MTPFRAAATGVALALLAPAAAHGASLTTNAPCYRQVATSTGIVSSTLGIAGAGWTPGSAWGLLIGGEPFASGTADAAGNFASSDQRAPQISTSRFKPQNFTVTGQQDGVDVATTTFQVVNFSVKPRSLEGKPTGKTTWLFSGFAARKAIFFHIKRGKRVYTARAGKGDSPCGTLKRRLRRLPAVPARQIKYGKYKVFVDNRRRFKRGGLQYTATITIRKIFL
jgi:hypothetical protein